MGILLTHLSDDVDTHSNSDNVASILALYKSYSNDASFFQHDWPVLETVDSEKVEE